MGNQNTVAGGNTHGETVSLLVHGARPNGHDLCLVELLHARFGQEDAAGRLGVGLEALNQYPVQQGSEASDGADRSGLMLSIQVSQRVNCRVMPSSRICREPRGLDGLIIVVGTRTIVMYDETPRQ